MKNIRRKKLLAILVAFLTVCLVAGAVTMLVLHRRESQWEEQQNEALRELYENEGRYDPQSIVLTNTTAARAEELAQVFGAKLRITSDGRFATLTLPPTPTCSARDTTRPTPPTCPRV